MSEVEFTVNPARDVEEPLYLDSATPRPPDRWRSAHAADLADAPDRPLRLDLAARPPSRRRSRGVPILACAVTFLIVAGAGALVLEPPAALRDSLVAIMAPAGTRAEKPAVPAAPDARTSLPAPQATREPGAIPTVQVEPLPPPTPPIAASAATSQEAPPASAPPAEPPAKARAAVGTPRRRRVPAPKTPPAEARSARAHRAAKASLDLEALEKSLR